MNIAYSFIHRNFFKEFQFDSYIKNPVHTPKLTSNEHIFVYFMQCFFK